MVVIHEVPGITEAVQAFSEQVVGAGFTVVLPSLLGTPTGVAASVGQALPALAKVCVSREFTAWATGQASPVTGWLRALAADLHAELGGPGVGAIGMCFSGGFALAMMLDGHTVAPVLSQPSLPFAVGRRRAADLGLSPAELDTVVARAQAGCRVLGLRYAGDPAVGTRFATLTRLLGEQFVAVELPGRKHSVLTEHRDEGAVRTVLDFLRERLR